MKMRKKSILSLMLALVMLFGIIPLNAFAATEYTVWIESDTMRGTRKIVVEAGDLINPPSVPRKADYYLEGWYTDSAFTDRWDFNRDTVEENMVLYARWLPFDSYHYYNPYRYYRDGAYYYDGYHYFYDPEEDEYYYYDALYYGGDPYWVGQYPRYREVYEVDGARGQVYTGSETISFRVRKNVSMISLLRVSVYPDGNREKEIILEKDVDYTLESGPTVTLTQSFLDTLVEDYYQVRMYFPNNQANATFTVK